MKLDEYITEVATRIANGVKAVNDRGINITPHLHQDIRGGKVPLPYGNSNFLLLPVEIEVELNDKAEASVGAEGFFAAIKAQFTSARRHRAKLTFWLELTKRVE